MAKRTVEDLRRDLEEFGFEVADEEYQNAVGLKDDVDTAPIYARYDHLHSIESLHLVRSALPGASGHDLRRLRFLEMDVLGTVISEPFVEEEDELATEESQATVTVDGETVTYRSVGIRIEEEDDRDLRRRFVAAERDVKRRFLPREESLEVRYRQAFADHGSGDDAERFEYQHGIPLAPLDADLQRVLADTRALYADALAERLLADEGLALKEAESHDVAHMMRAKRFDRYFPKAGLEDALHRFLGGLGFDVRAMPNVTLDLADRPNKESRAFVLPARVPSDVRLVTRPTGGADDWKGLFHESGHLLHFAFTQAELPYEDRYVGDDGVTEGYAFLFEHLFENPLFLEEFVPDLAGDALADYLRHAGLEKVTSLRYYAQALHYDLWLAKHDIDGAPEKYAAWMTDALIVPADPLNYLDTDGFYGVFYLRAWLFEVLHRRHLEREFGARWWRDPRAGEHLRRLFARGTRPTVEELARELGHERLPWELVVEDARRLLAA